MVNIWCRKNWIMCVCFWVCLCALGPFSVIIPVLKWCLYTCFYDKGHYMWKVYCISSVASLQSLVQTNALKIEPSFSLHTSQLTAPSGRRGGVKCRNKFNVVVVLTAEVDVSLTTQNPFSSSSPPTKSQSHIGVCMHVCAMVCGWSQTCVWCMCLRVSVHI